MMSLTRKQAELLDFIIGRIDETGIAPSFQDMMEATGHKSKNSIHRILCALEERGHIRRSPFRARSIELCSDLEGWDDKALIAEMSRRGYAVQVVA